MTVRVTDESGLRLRVGRGFEGGAGGARARRRRPCVAGRPDRAGRRRTANTRARRAGRGDPAARPPQSGLCGDGRAARRAAPCRAAPAAGHAVRVAAGRSQPCLEGGRALVAGAARPGVRGRAGDDPVLPCGRRTRRRAPGASREAAAPASRPRARSTCSSGTAKVSTGLGPAPSSTMQSGTRGVASRAGWPVFRGSCAAATSARGRAGRPDEPRRRLQLRVLYWGVSGSASGGAPKEAARRSAATSP